MMLYGFIVGAFLLTTLPDRVVMVPFTTMERCEVALAEMKKSYSPDWQKYFVCVETGK